MKIKKALHILVILAVTGQLSAGGPAFGQGRLRPDSLRPRATEERDKSRDAGETTQGSEGRPRPLAEKGLERVKNLPDVVARNYTLHRIERIRGGTAADSPLVIEAVDVFGQHRVVITVPRRARKRLEKKLKAPLSEEGRHKFSILLHNSYFSAEYETDKSGQPLLYRDNDILFLGSAGKPISLSRFWTGELLTFERFEPIRPFMSFAEEKEFYKYRHPDKQSIGWVTALDGCARGIRKALRLVNSIPFLYSAGRSDSGIPADHAEGARYLFSENAELGHADFMWSAPGKFTETWRRLLKGGDSRKYAGRGYCGYITLRADEKNPDYQRFLSGLTALENVDIIDFQYDKSKKVLRVMAPPEIYNRNRNEYQSWFIQKWEQVENCLRQFAPKEVFEQSFEGRFPSAAAMKAAIEEVERAAQQSILKKQVELLAVQV